MYYMKKYFLSDHKASGRPVCSWSSSALLPVGCKVDWAATAACGSHAQSEAAGSKRAIQFHLDPTSLTATNITSSTATTITSRYVLVHCTHALQTMS